MNFIKLSILFTVCISIFGCASIEYTFNKPEYDMVYVGTRKEAEFIAGTVGSLVANEPGNWGVLILPVALFDFPMSIVADTLLLPYTITNSHDYDAIPKK